MRLFRLFFFFQAEDGIRDIGVTGVQTCALPISAMVGRQLPIFSLIIPGFMIYVMAGWRGMMQVLPAVLTAGVTFAVAQFITANFLGPALVDVLAALVSLAALYLLLQFWQPRTAWRFEEEPATAEDSPSVAEGGPSGRPGPATGFAAGSIPSGGGSSTFSGFLPYIILVVSVILSRISELLPGLRSEEHTYELQARQYLVCRLLLEKKNS